MDLDVYVAVDVETSGFGSKDQVLEVGVVHYWNGRVVRRYSELVCPKDLSFDDEHVKTALAVSGLSVEALMFGAYTFQKVVERFEKEISEPIWVMHNAIFDTRMIRQEYQRLGAPMPIPEGGVFCTQELDKLINPSVTGGRKLSEVAERWGVQNNKEHRALGDAEACGDVFARMLEVLPKSFDDIAYMYKHKQTLDWFKQVRGIQ